MSRQIYISAIVLLLPATLLASEVESILGGLEQLIFIGITIVITTLTTMIIYLFNRKRKIANILYVIGGIAVFAGLLMM